MRSTTRTFLIAGAAAIAVATLGTTPASADPGFRADPGEVLFDFVPVGQTSAPRTVALYNNGTSETTFGALSIVGSGSGDFLLIEDGCSGRTIASGGGCAVKVAFRPTATGTRLASLRIPDGTSCRNWVDLAGSGSETNPPARAHASICNQGEDKVAVQLTPPTGNGALPVISNNSIVEGPTKRCVSKRRFRIRLAPPRGTRIDKATVIVAGKNVKTERVGGRTTAWVDLRGASKGTSVVEITILATNGRTYKGKRTYRTCSRKEAGGSPRY